MIMAASKNMESTTRRHTLQLLVGLLFG